MKWISARYTIVLLFSVFLLPTQSPAQSGGPIVSNTEIGLVIGGIAAAGAAIGIGSYYFVSHSHHFVKGCAVSGANGLRLLNEGDQKTFLLQGSTTDVKPGNRVSLKGNKTKVPKGNTGDPTFAVEKVAKDYGVCKSAPTTP